MKSLIIDITGIVQGVGFRPFVAKLATEHGIKGTVMNTGGGVTIHAFAPEEPLARFLFDLKDKKPSQSHIAEFSVREGNGDYPDFRILPSVSTAGVVFVPTDIAACEDCLKEMSDPSDRRYQYPFINCTQCGPRYSIIRSLPYDRESTTMAGFAMCAECGREYALPSDRRYHAQPNACPVCGPDVWMGALRGGEAIKKAASLVDDGEIIAMRGLGGYHLICDAYNASAVARLRELKERPTKPFAVMSTDLSAFEMTEKVRQELFSGATPIISLPCNDKELIQNINPLGSEVGLMLPYTPLHRLLLGFAKASIIVATSGNRHDEAIAKSPEEAEEALCSFTEYFLHHNRPIYNRIDDSVAMYAAGELRLLRRGRGYAPFPVTLPLKGRRPIFGGGAGLKSTISLTKGQYAFTSAHIGDLDNEASTEFYAESYEHMCSLLNLRPELAVCDLHPGYYSTHFAESLNIDILRLQHHKAHMYAAMAEHGLKDGVIGIIMDGTGYGEDGSIWGCEFFSLAAGEITRHYHLEYVPQAAGDSSVKHPSRMAQSWLMAADMWGGYEDFWLERMRLSADVAKLTYGMIKSSLNTIPTSSAGRLCEAVGAMLLGIGTNEYEAHAAVVLENRAGASAECYPYAIEGDSLVFKDAVRQLAKDIVNCEKIELISARFHNSLARAAVAACTRVSAETGIKAVVLSGGVFQNKRLLESIYGMLEQAGLKPFAHKYVPANDGGISLGQAYYGVLY